MKNKFWYALCMLLLLTITGCSKYEKDTSYNADLNGTYSQSVDATNTSYSFDETYNFNTDDTYSHTINEIINDQVTNDYNDSGEIISIEEVSNDVTKITLDRIITAFSTKEKSNEVIYKYKNMLGSYDEMKIPDGKTFKLFLKSGVWFDKNGQYHMCVDDNSCDCSNICPKYVRKGNIIYFRSMDEAHKNIYTISFYIVDGGLFFPELYKIED